MRSSIACLPTGSGAGTTRNQVQDKENCNSFQVVKRGLATTQQLDDLGLNKQEKVRAAMQYDPGMKPMKESAKRPQVDTYPWARPAGIDRNPQSAVVYQKGTKKFWERTMEIQGSRPKQEREVIPDVRLLMIS